MKYWLFARQLLSELSRQYHIPKPRMRLAFSDIGKYSAIYQEFTEEILVRKEVLQSQSETFATIRHEFAHYWEDFTGLPYSERRARRFEKPYERLYLPHGQKMLIEFLEVSNTP